MESRLRAPRHGWHKKVFSIPGISIRCQKAPPEAALFITRTMLQNISTGEFYRVPDNHPEARVFITGPLPLKKFLIRGSKKVHAKKSTIQRFSA
jgi:hypothetical protein